jgi:hypothetical protein
VKKEDGVLRKCYYTKALNEIDDEREWGQWAILARTNIEVETIREILNERDIDNITFKKSDFDNPEEIEKAMKSNFNKGLKKKEIIDGYVQLRQAAMNEVSVDMVRQTVALLLYSLRISERGYSDDQLREMYRNFVAVINFPEYMGKRLRSDDITDFITKELGIDLEEINPEIGE